jgi:hypothetical protein
MRFALALLALIALAGCTAKYDLAGAEWAKPGMMHQQVTLDEIDCAREAREAGYTPDLFVGGVVDVARYFIEDRQRYGTYERCMSGRGYVRASKA